MFGDDDDDEPDRIENIELDFSSMRSYSVLIDRSFLGWASQSVIGKVKFSNGSAHLGSTLDWHT